MESPRPETPAGHLAGILAGMVVIALRLAAVVAVTGAGYYTFMWFGPDWFRVYVFGAIAACLHFELRRIEREYPGD